MNRVVRIVEKEWKSQFKFKGTMIITQILSYSKEEKIILILYAGFIGGLDKFIKSDRSREF